MAAPGTSKTEKSLWVGWVLRFSGGESTWQGFLLEMQVWHTHVWSCGQVPALPKKPAWFQAHPGQCANTHASVLFASQDLH